jgi:hypothetical protein
MKEKKEKFADESVEKQNWREWVNYPDHILPESQETLDLLVSGLGAPPFEDRYSKMSWILEEGEKRKLLEKGDAFRLRAEIGPYM